MKSINIKNSNSCVLNIFIFIISLNIYIKNIIICARYILGFLNIIICVINILGFFNIIIYVINFSFDRTLKSLHSF
jgi:hypothetical protein